MTKATNPQAVDISATRGRKGHDSMTEAWKEWERAVAREAREHGLPWERRLRGGDQNDLLDIDGCQPDGWLIGAKTGRRGYDLVTRLSDAMKQSDRAMSNAERMYPNLAGGMIPVQVFARKGYPVSRAYAVTEYRYLLQLVVERRKWQANR